MRAPAAARNRAAARRRASSRRRRRRRRRHPFPPPPPPQAAAATAKVAIDGAQREIRDMQQLADKLHEKDKVRNAELQKTNLQVLQGQAEIKTLREWKNKMSSMPGFKEFMKDVKPPAGAGAADAGDAFGAGGGAGAAGDRPFLPCGICLEDAKEKTLWHALGCPPQKKASGGVTHCRGYLCESCSAALKKRECPFCGHEPILPLDKRPIFFPCAN